MKTPILVLAMAASMLASCSNTAVRDGLGIQDPTILQTGAGAGQGADAGAATDQWLEAYGAIGNTGDALASTSRKLDALPADVKGSYFAAKGRCWIAAGQAERDASNHWGFVEESIGEASRQLAMAEGRAPQSAANPELRTSSVIRPDLWQKINGYKADRRINDCPELQPELACAEVKLIHAGHEAWTRDFDGAKARADEVGRMLAEVGAGVEACKPPAPPPAVVVPAKITLRADATFGFDEGDESGLLPEGRAALDKLVADLRLAPDVTGIDIVGHTDRLGTPPYNERLSMQRASTVKRYLEKRGVDVPIGARGVGAGNPVVDCHQGNRTALIQCLSPNRRVDVYVRRR